jgi:SpoVK/Ycf46/Vps4 family AAA+-type ATPase
MLRNVKDDLVDVVRAGYSHIYVQTDQMARAIDYMSDILSSYVRSDGSKYKPVVWSLGASKEDNDPMVALQKLEKAEGNSVFFLKNYGWALDSRNPIGNQAMDITQRIQNSLRDYRRKGARKVMVVVSNRRMEEALPSEIRGDFVPLKFDRPDLVEITSIMDFMMESERSAGGKGEYSPEEREKIFQAVRGMAYQEIEDALSFSIVKQGRIDPTFLHSIKAMMLDKVAGIEYGIYPDRFSNLLGYEVLKEFVLSTINDPLAKGIILVGPPGCGKTSFCRCLGNETGMPVLQVELAKIFGSLLGESYERMAALIDVIKAMGRCIVLLDEMEKGMSGVSGDGGTTGTEVTVRVMSMLLKYMSEPRESYIISTVNDIGAFRSAPEYLRAERWDCAPFYIGLPSVQEKKSILDYYKDYFEVEGDLGTMDGWSGAEIRAACRIAKMRKSKLENVRQFVIPISQILGDKISSLEEWAKTNAINASIVRKAEKARGRDMDLDLSRGVDWKGRRK